jgi:hypothetical protein
MTAPGSDLADLANRTEAVVTPELENVGDLTTPEEMFGGVVGHREPVPYPMPEYVGTELDQTGE